METLTTENDSKATVYVKSGGKDRFIVVRACCTPSAVERALLPGVWYTSRKEAGLSPWKDWRL
jgi:hypothetical protein